MPSRVRQDIFRKWLEAGKPQKASFIRAWNGQYPDNKVNKDEFRRQSNSQEAKRIMALSTIVDKRYSDFYPPLGEAWTLELDDCVICADVQLPHTKDEWVDRLCAVGKQHLPKGNRTLVCAGDVVNMDAFSDYEPENPLPSLSQELGAADKFWKDVLRVYDTVYWFMGNHEYRATKRTKAQITPYLLARMVLGRHYDEERTRISHWGYLFLNTSQGKWIVAHGKNYSVQSLSVGEWLSWKYNLNVISFHQHHLARGYDRFGRFQVIDGGGLFEQSQMGYAVTHASKSANMVNGFVLMKDSVAHLLGPDGFTDWRQLIK